VAVSGDLVNTLVDIARALGVSPQRVGQVRKRPWFPPGPPWDVEAVRAAWSANAKKSHTRVKVARELPAGTGDPPRASNHAPLLRAKLAEERKRAAPGASVARPGPGN